MTLLPRFSEEPQVVCLHVCLLAGFQGSKVMYQRADQSPTVTRKFDRLLGCVACSLFFNIANNHVHCQATLKSTNRDRNTYTCCIEKKDGLRGTHNAANSIESQIEWPVTEWCLGLCGVLEASN